MSSETAQAAARGASSFSYTRRRPAALTAPA